MQEEIWKDIPGWEGLYQASNLGNIKGVDRWVVGKDGKSYHIKESIRLLHSTPTCEYLVVVLSRNRHFSNHLVHVLVCSAFHGKREGLLEVNHIDGNKQNNRPENLEWVSRVQNQRHAMQTGLRRDSGGDNSRSFFTNDTAILIRKRFANGEKISDMAKEYGCHPKTLRLIVRHKTYKTV